MMTRELTERELEAATQARLAYESEFDLRLYTLRDVGLFQDGFKAGLEYQEAQAAALQAENAKLQAACKAAADLLGRVGYEGGGTYEMIRAALKAE